MYRFTKNFIQTFNDIVSLRIQGAEAITHRGARAAVKEMIRGIDRIPEPDYAPGRYWDVCCAVRDKILLARPTEPHLKNTLDMVIGKKKPKTKKWALHKLNNGLRIIEEHHNTIYEAIAAIAKGELSKYSSAYTHCHSSMVEKAIIVSKIKKVYNTETRPLYQGRITAKNLSKNANVHHYVDSAMSIAIEKSDVVLLGADSITLRGDVINKIGSGMIGIIARHHNKPLYVISDIFKLDMGSARKDTRIEERPYKEVWNKGMKGLHINNPAFEVLRSEHIRAIICEKGALSPKEFVKVARKELGYRMKN